MIDISKVGKKIEQLRSSNNMTQNDLAQKMFVTHQAVSKWERGINLPSIETIVLLTDLFGVSFDELIYDLEVTTENIEELLKTHSRNYLMQNLLESKIDNLSDVFYLFDKNERLQLLHRLVKNNDFEVIEEVWAYLSKSERRYLLSSIMLDIVKTMNLTITLEETMILKKRRTENGRISIR